jgi:hypothetical protein
MPRIPDKILDTVFCLYADEADARRGLEFGGSGFIVSYPSAIHTNPPIEFYYAVTNWHVACRDLYPRSVQVEICGRNL